MNRPHNSASAWLSKLFRRASEIHPIESLKQLVQDAGEPTVYPVYDVALAQTVNLVLGRASDAAKHHEPQVKFSVKLPASELSDAREPIALYGPLMYEAESYGLVLHGLVTGIRSTTFTFSTFHTYPAHQAH